MGYIIAIFNNKSNTLKFYNILKKHGVKASVISTPRVAGLKCGVCVKFEKQSYRLVVNLLYGVDSNDFIGFYEITKDGVKTITTRI